MLSFPLINRELRVQARRRSTYTLRIGWGLAAVGLLLLFCVSFPSQSANGAIFLSTVHFCLALMIFVLAPVGAADAISREKREGTLGLLLLTRLTPIQVVLGKLAAHSIRLFYFAFMMLPFLVIPALLGGVSAQDFLLVFAMLFALGAAGIAAGLIASAIFTSFGAAVAWAIILTALIVTVIGSTVANSALEIFSNRQLDDIWWPFRIFVLGPGLILLPISARDVAPMFVGAPWLFPFLEGGVITLSLLFLGMAILFAARRVAQKREFAGETKRQAAFRKQFLTPILWRTYFRRIMSRKLDANPFIWLEYRTAWARSARWAMILLAVITETAVLLLMPDRKEFMDLHFIILCVLVTFIALKSSSSFQREKESGAFELILVTPLTEKALWLGRLRAVASYYGLTIISLAALGAAGFTMLLESSYRTDELSRYVYFLSMCLSIVSVPVCGLFFALRYKTFVASLLWSAGVAVLLPLCIWAAFTGVFWYASARLQWSPALLLYDLLQDTWWPVLFAVVAYHAAVSCKLSRATLSLLRQREFTA